MRSILEVEGLHTYFYIQEEIVKAVEGVNLSLREGEILGLVGESACGKTVLAYSLMRLIQRPGEIVKGRIIFEGEDLLKLSSSQMRKIRGSKMAIIFQEPSSALNPLYTVGFQIKEMVKIHRKDISGYELDKLTLELLRKVGLNDAALYLNAYPHNLSGGQNQRVIIAMAVSCRPLLLIADEPTTALDVTVQAQIRELFLKLREEMNLSVILITHNLALCYQTADRVAIMYAGKIVEEAAAKEIFTYPLHPYTRALISSLPQPQASKRRLKAIKGVVPNASSKPKGCHFHPRCPLKEDICTISYPQFLEVRPAHWVSCFRAGSA